MCGIAGRVNLMAPVDRSELFAMSDRMAHRGPDDHGYHLRPRIGLGHRRLSIVDLAGGRQPLANEDESVWIAFNGEIYNHLDLRRDLQARGHRFRTKSDTEAIVHAYEEWGALGCARRLRGMFAFAIWDERAQSLTLVRDRLGIKPIYWALLGKDLAFASEAKSLVAIPELDGRVDDDALAAYLALRYVPAPATLFRGIRKLTPATILTWKGGLVSLETYWDVAQTPILEVPPTEAEAAYTLRERIDEATRLRLMSEVPLGAFLSGGLDSTMIAASMQPHMSQRLKTFSVGYADAPESELGWARRAAEALGTEHHEVLVTMDDAREMLPRIVWHLDEPVADPACVPLYFLARRAKEEVTVVLSGEGADEVLAGYNVYQRLARFEQLRTLPFVAAAARLGEYMPNSKARHLAQLLGGPLEATYHGVTRAFDAAGLRQLMPGAPPLDSLLASHWEPTRGLSPLRRMLYLDTRVWLPDDLLVKADKMTMAHAVELRVPFLDHLLVEHCWSLPDALKVNARGKYLPGMQYLLGALNINAKGKYLLRKAARGRVPRFVIERTKKGFATPTAHWLRTGLRELLNDSLLHGRSFTRDRFRLAHVRALLDRHQRGADLSNELWPLLVLELWHSQFSTRPAVREPFHAAS
jgi:asparagine synthase (glutamine-hydrolysing)